MAYDDIVLKGYVYNDSGAGVNGATVKIYAGDSADTSTHGSAIGSGDTTDSNGEWTITSSNSATDANNRLDVEITSGGSSSKRRIKYRDSIQVENIDVEKIIVRAVDTGAATVHFFADGAGDAGDYWRLNASASNSFAIGSDRAVEGTIIDYLTITNGASAAASKTTILGQLVVGIDDTGADVKFFGATAGSYWLWDESADGVVQIGTLTVGVDDAGHDVKLFGDTASRYWLWDTSADGVVQRGTLTVGVDDTGHDVKFFGATSGQYLLWDESADELVLTGDTKLSFHDAAGGENIIASSNGHLEVNAGTTLDVTAPTVDINAGTAFEVDTAEISLDSSGASNLTTSGGALTITSAAAATWSTAAGVLTIDGDDGIVLNTGGSGDLQVNENILVGADDAGFDVTFYGNTASRYWLWDTSADGVVQRGTLTVGVDDTGHDVKLFGATAGSYWLWDESADGVVQIGTLTVGVDDAGHDVKFFGDTASAYMLWDTSADDLILGGAAGLIVPDGQFTLGSTAVGSTAAELNLLDGSAKSTSSITIGDTDAFVIIDGTTTKQIPASDLKTYTAASATALDDVAAGDAAANLHTTVGNITIDAQANDADVIIKVDDNGSAVTAVTFDGSDEGNAIFVNDVQLKSDGALLEFGADLDTTLTHTDGTGLTLNSTNKLTFGDAATFIHQSGDGVMTIDGEATIDLNASTAVLVSNDLKLDSDSAVLSFGADSEATVTHADDAGLTFNSDITMAADKS